MQRATALLPACQTARDGFDHFFFKFFFRRFCLAALDDDGWPDEQDGDARRRLCECQMQRTQRQHRGVGIADFHGLRTVAENHAFDAFELVKIKIFKCVFLGEFR